MNESNSLLLKVFTPYSSAFKKLAMKNAFAPVVDKLYRKMISTIYLSPEKVESFSEVISKDSGITRIFDGAGKAGIYYTDPMYPGFYIDFNYLGDTANGADNTFISISRDTPGIEGYSTETRLELVNETIVCLKVARMIRGTPSMARNRIGPVTIGDKKHVLVPIDKYAGVIEEILFSEGYPSYTLIGDPEFKDYISYREEDGHITFEFTNKKDIIKKIQDDIHELVNCLTKL